MPSGFTTVLIVDDEYLVRQKLKNCIDWKGLGFEVIGEAAFSSEALEMIEEQVPDIIITDINMPVINGIEMSEKILKDYPKVKIIVVTGYNEFEYAKKGIKIGIEDYILKPINTEELKKSVLKAKEKILSVRKQEYEYYKIRQMIKDQDYSPVLHGNVKQFPIIEDDEFEQIKFFIKAGMKKEAFAWVGNIFYYLWSKENAENKKFIEYAKIQTSRIVTIILSVLYAMDDYDEEVVPNENELFDTIFEIESFSLLEKYLKNFVEETITYINHKHTHRARDYIKEIESYIQENVCDDRLSLKGTAKHFFMNPNYLSRIFKQKMGISFREYVNKIRMEKAIEYLRKSDLKVYEISEKIGIRDANYFSVIFKKYVGMSITEYRNLIRENQ